MESIRKLLGELRNDDFRYGLLDDGDSLLVGISPNVAGLCFLSILKDYSHFQKKTFKVQPIMINIGFDEKRIKDVSSFVSSLGYKLEVLDCIIPFENQLYKKKGSFSYPIYSRFVKGALFDYAYLNGFNKIVLCHDLLDIQVLFHLSLKEDPSLPLLPIKESDPLRRISLIRPFLFLEHEILLDAASKKGIEAAEPGYIDKGERYHRALEELNNGVITSSGFKKRIALLDIYQKDEELGSEEHCPYSLHRVNNASDCARYMQFQKEQVIPHFSQNLEYYLIYQKHQPIGQVTIEMKNAHEAFIISYYAPEKNEEIENMIFDFISSQANPMIISSYIDLSFYKGKRPTEAGLFIIKSKR